MKRESFRVAIVSPLDAVADRLGAMLSHFPERVQVVDLAFGFESDNPDVVLYDAGALREGRGADLKKLVEETTSAVLVVAHEPGTDLEARARSMGVDGYFLVGVNAEDLVEAVEAATADAVDAAPPGSPTGGADTFEAREAREVRLGQDVGLTERETDVLSLITRGLSNQEIADKSYLSINSVKTYIRSAYRRIGVTNRSQAVVWCIRHGFPTDDV